MLLWFLGDVKVSRRTCGFGRDCPEGLNELKDGRWLVSGLPAVVGAEDACFVRPLWLHKIIWGSSFNSEGRAS